MRFAYHLLAVKELKEPTEIEYNFVIAKAWRKFLLPTFRDERIVYSDSWKNKRIDETKEV